jgi:hypothetical protein
MLAGRRMTFLHGAQRDIIDRTGSTPAGAVKALQALAGSFLQATTPPLGKPGWAFRHPTLWKGFASWLPAQSHLLTVVLDGLTVRYPVRTVQLAALWLSSILLIIRQSWVRDPPAPPSLAWQDSPITS